MHPDVEEAIQLLHEAGGEITGLLFAATIGRARYITQVAGYCRRNPTYARGMVAALDDKLRDLVHQRDPGETR